MEPIRILQVVPAMNTGGMETFIMNLYRAMDREKVQFDFLYHYDMPCFYDEEILRLGGRITKLTVRQDNNLPKYLHQLNEFFARHTEYRVIHGHYSGFGMFYNAAAKKNGITVRAGHSHNTNYEHNLVGWLDRAMSFFFTYGLTDRFACGQEAGKALFRGKPFRFLPNGVDAAAFGPDEAQRAAVRRQLGVPEDAPLYGHIGRFCQQKNHGYLLDIFEQILKRQPRARLVLLVDDGSTDDSAQKCSRVCAEDARFRLLRQKNAGPAAARLTGIRAASGQYFAFMDADDRLAPEHLARLAAGAKAGHALCCTGWQSVADRPPEAVPKAEAPGWLAGPNQLNRLLHDRAIGWGLWNKLYSRRLIEAVKWPVGVRHNEDLWANWRLFAAADGLYFDPAPTYCYRLTEGSASRRTPTPENLQDHWTVAQAILNEAEGTPSEESARAFHYEKMLYLYSMALRQKDMAPYRPLMQELAGHIRAEFGPAMGSPYLPRPMKAAAVLTRFGGPVYRALCRMLLPKGSG